MKSRNVLLACCGRRVRMGPASNIGTSGQRSNGNGNAYEITGTELWDIADPKSGRRYQVFVSLPRTYSENPNRHYPVLYVTDAD